MSKSSTKTLQTNATVLNVEIDGDSQIEVTGTFGSVALTGPSGLTAAEVSPITTNDMFKSTMTNMKFTLTGTGPVQVTVYPTRIANISRFELTP